VRGPNRKETNDPSVRPESAAFGASFLIVTIVLLRSCGRQVVLQGVGLVSNSQEIQARLKANGIASVLTLALEEASSTVTGVSTLAATSNLWGLTATNTTISTQTKENAVYSATLYNEASGRVVWQSQAFTSGNEYAGWNEIRTSFIQKTVSDLSAARVLFLCVPPERIATA
jgi:hypothetical protein